MSTGDGRHKIGSKAERELHGEITAATRMIVDGYCAARQRQQDDGEGYELKRSVYQQEIADHLGVSRRQLSSYQSTVPITLSKSVLLSKFCRDERLLAIFARHLGAVAVALPLPDRVLDLKAAVQECSATLKETAEAQEAANALMSDARSEPEAARRTIKECTEAIIQLVHVIFLHEMAAFGSVKFPILSWARRRHAAMPGVNPCDPNVDRPGWWAREGFGADAPETPKEASK